MSRKEELKARLIENTEATKKGTQHLETARTALASADKIQDDANVQLKGQGEKIDKAIGIVKKAK